MDFKKCGNFNWIEMNSKYQNLDLTQKRIYFCPFQFIFIYWAVEMVNRLLRESNRHINT